MMIFYFLLVYWGSILSEHSNNGDSSSKTFFRGITPFQDASPERVSIYQHTKNRKSSLFFQLTPFYSFSTETNKISQYFLPWGHNQLVFANNIDFYKTLGTEDFNSGIQKDVDLTHFNFPTESSPSNLYQSVIKLEPKEKIHGIGIVLRKNIYKTNLDEYKFALELSSPLIFSEHTINVIEKNYIESKETTFPFANIKDMLKNSNFQYGKIASSKKMKSFGLADLSINIIYMSSPSDSCSTETYLGLLLPTGNTPGKDGNRYRNYLWEPIIGNGGHWGLKYGNNLEIIISKNYHHEIMFMVHTDTTFLFKNRQMRLFELKNKSWSRYMSIWASKKSMLEDKSDTLLNYTFLTCDISPYFMFNSTTSFMYSKDIFKGIIGYNFYTRQAEKINIIDSISPICLKGASSKEKKPMVSLARDIKMRYELEDNNGFDKSLEKNPFKYYDLFQLKAKNIDKTSGAHPAVFSSSLFGYIEFTPNSLKENVWLGVGASHRFESNNSALPSTTIWGTIQYFF